MRRRRQDNFFDDLFKLLTVLPWWCGLVLAALTYPLFRYLFPALLGVGSGDPMGAAMSNMLGSIVIGIAPWASLFVLGLWAAAELKKLLDRRRLNAQTDLDSIRRLPWREFELLVCEVFRRQGYLVEHTGSDGPDGGVDLVLQRDGEKSLVQCKQWRLESVGVKLVRELLGVVTSQGAHRGIFVTSGSYTEEARAFARGNPLTLISGEELMAMIRSVQTEPAAPPVPPVPSPQEPERSAPSVQAPKCPQCGSIMVRRTAKQGANAGSQFWGCPRYPQCRGTRS